MDMLTWKDEEEQKARRGRMDDKTEVRGLSVVDTEARRTVKSWGMRDLRIE